MTVMDFAALKVLKQSPGKEVCLRNATATDKQTVLSGAPLPKGNQGARSIIRYLRFNE
jgi:hypothetical protein